MKKRLATTFKSAFGRGLIWGIGSYLINFYGYFLGSDEYWTICLWIRLGYNGALIDAYGLGIRVTMRIFGTLGIGRDRGIAMGTLIANSGATTSAYGENFGQGANDRGYRNETTS